MYDISTILRFINTGDIAQLNIVAKKLLEDVEQAGAALNIKINETLLKEVMTDLLLTLKLDHGQIAHSREAIISSILELTPRKVDSPAYSTSSDSDSDSSDSKAYSSDDDDDDEIDVAELASDSDLQKSTDSDHYAITVMNILRESLSDLEKNKITQRHQFPLILSALTDWTKKPLNIIDDYGSKKKLDPFGQKAHFYSKDEIKRNKKSKTVRFQALPEIINPTEPKQKLVAAPPSPPALRNPNKATPNKTPPKKNHDDLPQGSFVSKFARAFWRLLGPSATRRRQQPVVQPLQRDTKSSIKSTTQMRAGLPDNKKLSSAKVLKTERLGPVASMANWFWRKTASNSTSVKVNPPQGAMNREKNKIKPRPPQEPRKTPVAPAKSGLFAAGNTGMLRVRTSAQPEIRSRPLTGADDKPRQRNVI